MLEIKSNADRLQLISYTMLIFRTATYFIMHAVLCVNPLTPRVKPWVMQNFKLLILWTEP